MRNHVLTSRCSAFTVLLSFATIAAAQGTTTAIDVKKGDAVVTTSELKGEVEYVEGNSLVVTLPGGELRTFNVPESRVFNVDGKKLTVHELVPGTKLTATVTTTMTPVTVRTITVQSGKVWHVMGNVVILTLPNGENKQYMAKDDTRFTINGNPATVRDLAKGMTVFAEKVVEEPTTEITMDTEVVGQAPAPAPAAAPPAETAPVVAQTPPAETPPAPVEPAPTDPTPAAPKAGSRIPLIAGLVLVAGILLIWVMRRKNS